MDKYVLEDKWSSEILDHGFTAVPNILIENIARLGLTSSHFLVLVCIEKYRWTNDRPWPSVDSIARLCGLSRRRVSDIITELEEDYGLIKRIRRDGRTSLYEMKPLIDTLDLLANPSRRPKNVLRMHKTIIEI